MKYIVEIPEVWKVIVEVECEEGDNIQDILEAAQKQFEEGVVDDSEYSHTLETDEWRVFDKSGRQIS